MTAEGLSAIPDIRPREAARLSRARLPTWVLVAVVVMMLVGKLAFHVTAGPNDDEAYYWAWGQHLAPSYFDHAPWVGWMAGVSAAVLGWTPFALRAGTLLTLAGSALIFWQWAKRFEPGDARNLFWSMCAIYLCTPQTFVFTSLAYPDHWLMFFCLASVHFFARFFGQHAEGRAGRTLDLYLGAGFLGLAALAKYNAVLLGLALVGYILADRRLRPLLRGPHLYLAALLSMALFAPVIWWNAENGFSSIRFQTGGRFAPGTWGAAGGFDPTRVWLFFLTSALYLSPTLIPALVAFLIRPAGAGVPGAVATLSKWLFGISTVLFSIISLWAGAAPHWNVLAILIVVPLTALCFRWRWLLATHLALGGAAMLFLVAHFTLVPLVSGPFGSREAAAVYGWPEVAARMEQLRVEHGAAAVAGLHYGPTSKLVFGGKSAVSVTALERQHDAYDEWRDDAALLGKDIIVNDEWGAGELKPQFDEVVFLEDIVVTRFGRPITKYPVYLGKGYRGLPPDLVP